MGSSRIILEKPRMKPRNESSLAERAYQLILDQILRGILPLGAVVSRRSLARQFGMRFISVTAALQRLEIDGLLESPPGWNPRQDSHLGRGTRPIRDA